MHALNRDDTIPFPYFILFHLVSHSIQVFHYVPFYPSIESRHPETLSENYISSTRLATTCINLFFIAPQPKLKIEFSSHPVNVTSLAIMTMIIGHALILLATISIVFSHGRIPDGYDCAWVNTACPVGQVSLARCNCNCPGSNLCCNVDILDDYFYPLWHESALFCNANC